jgi:hypothetical protein
MRHLGEEEQSLTGRLTTSSQPTLFETPVAVTAVSESSSFESQLRAFTWDGKQTAVQARAVDVDGSPLKVNAFVNEFWTSRQRAAHSLHEVSYRACFKPQLPRFFIERLTQPGDTVYDPFMGRGTTVLESALLGRTPIGCDINPLSAFLVGPRLDPPSLDDVAARLAAVDWQESEEVPDDLLTFYHADTLREIGALRAYLRRRRDARSLDAVDGWIRMVAVNRLTGHSPGFFSVYTLPPNQAASVAAQRKINAGRNQAPVYRNVTELILRKSRSLLTDCTASARLVLATARVESRLLTGPAATTPQLASSSVDLVVTSPPFLDVVNYAGDNWLRCWFCEIEPGSVKLTMLKRIEDWRQAMTDVFGELARVLKPGGHVAFEVGEVRGGHVRLEEHVIPCGMHAGLEPLLVLLNSQHFTKTAACWGVENNTKGTNTNRIVLFRKPHLVA